jgi:hypothetical protein
MVTSTAARTKMIPRYPTTKIQPASPNADGMTSAITRLPNMAKMIRHWISGRRGSNRSVSQTISSQTHHVASSSTATRSTPTAVRFPSSSPASRRKMKM